VSANIEGSLDKPCISILSKKEDKRFTKAIHMDEIKIVLLLPSNASVISGAEGWGL
jgi:hypothetical protein